MPMLGAHVRLVRVEQLSVVFFSSEMLWQISYRWGGGRRASAC